MIGQPRAVCWACDVQTRRKRARRIQITMSDEVSLREPPEPEPGIKVEHAWICKENNRLIGRVEFAQDLFHQQPRQPAVAVVGMRCHCAELIAIARLTVDHVSHGRATNRADYLVVCDHRKDVVSVTPAAARSPIRKRLTATLEDRCDEGEETIMPSAISIAN